MPKHRKHSQTREERFQSFSLCQLSILGASEKVCEYVCVDLRVLYLYVTKQRERERDNPKREDGRECVCMKIIRALYRDEIYSLYVVG